VTTTPDPRQVRTRAALIAAATALVDERDTPDISVTDLAKRAGVTRMTLYQHFSDRDSLLQAAGLARYETALQEHHAGGGDRNVEAVAVSLFEHLTRHRDFYARLLSGTCGLQTYRAIQEFLADGIQRAAEIDGSVLESGERLFLSGGAMAYLIWWLDADRSGEHTPSAAASRVARLLEVHLREHRSRPPASSCAAAARAPLQTAPDVSVGSAEWATPTLRA